MSLSVPVAFLIFNRPDLTQIVFQAIAQAKPKKLLVIADGPRFPQEAEKCEKARAVIEKVDWECQVLTNFSEINMGCKRRISSGIDWVFENVEEAIILEDDCLPNPSFFRFCEVLLNKYRNDERIMMISGDNFLKDKPEIQESYLFSRYFAIWGWATWKRAWLKYDIKMKDWERLKTQKQLESLYSQQYMRTYISEMFDEAYRNEIDTWDIQWFYACLFNNAVSIVPRVNLVSNIGIIGTHSSSVGQNQNLPTYPLDCEQMQHPYMISPNYLYDNAYFENNFMPETKDSPKHHVGTMIKNKASAIYRYFKNHVSRSEIAQKPNRPDPKEYSTIGGAGSVVPCQIEAYFLALNKYVDEGSSVLDVGFGLGYGLNILAIKANKVSGIDVDHKVYDYCQGIVVDRNPRLAHLGIYDGYHINFPDNHFDVVTCVDVIEHVEDYDKLIDEMLRVAKKGVFLSTPNRRPEYTNSDGTPKNYWHLREWSREEFDEIIKKYGEVDWNFLNGPFEGPFTRSETIKEDTLTLSPFIFKNKGMYSLR